MVVHVVKLFTDIDLDGLGCGIVAKMAFGKNVNVTYCSYRNLNQRVEKFIENPENYDENLYITDLSVNEIVKNKLDKRYHDGHHVKVIDHHITALHFNHYKWGLVKLEYDSGKKTCATSLLYDYLVEKDLIQRNRALEEFIELVRQYDTWEWDENNNITAKRLNDLFYILNREQFEDEMLKRLTNHPEYFSLSETETFILDIEDHKIERYIHSKNRQLVQTFVDEYCIGIVHAEQYLSELGNALNKLNPHLDMIVLLKIGSKKMGFRTIHDSIDVAEFAKRFGGGGHPKASGSDLTKESFEKFVVHVFELSPIKPDPLLNVLNVKQAGYGTVYQNRKGEFSYIAVQSNGVYIVVHNQKKIGQSFELYEAAERFVKRNFESWLSFDDECLKHFSLSYSTPLEDHKDNYIQLINRIMNSFLDGSI